MKARLRTQKTTVFDNTITTPAEAQAFIDAHDTETSSSMAQIQQDAVCGLVLRLKGAGTPNGNDLWSKFDTAGTRLWPLTPIDDSTANANAYGMELMSATSLGTYINFVGGDFAANGVTGDGSTKYFRTDVNMNTFPQDDVAHGCMISQRNDTINRIRLGGDAGSGNQILMQNQNNLTDLVWRVNDASVPTQTIASIPETGLFVIQRADSATKTYHIDGSQVGSLSVASSGTISTLMGFHSFLRSNSTALSPSSDRFSFYLYGMPSLTANEHEDLNAALDWYQQNVITGGR